MFIEILETIQAFAKDELILKSYQQNVLTNQT